MIHVGGNTHLIMMHPHIEDEETVERYVRHQLAQDQQDLLEEHLMGCRECFERVQDAERFHAGVRDAAARGLLDDDAETASSRGWLPWAFGTAVCAAAASVAITGWMYFNEIPRLRRDLERNMAQLEVERQTRSSQPAGPADRTEANTPLVILQASRASDKPSSVVLAPNSKQLIVWIEVGSTRYRRFQIDVLSSSGQPVTTVRQLEPGPYGALVASLPADTLPAGDLRITLSGQDPAPASVVADYQLTIRRQ